MFEDVFGEHTREATERIEDLIEQDTQAIWNDIQSDAEEGSSTAWREKIAYIAQDYLVSSRFGLMRILHARVYNSCHPENRDFPTNKPWPDQICASKDQFKVPVDGKWIIFSDISIEHSKKLSVQEHLDYIAYLKQIASTSGDTDPVFAEQVILKAWHDTDSADLISEAQLPQTTATHERAQRKEYTAANARKYGKRMTREDALELGHLLQFSIMEMQWFLMRVFDTEDGLRLNHANDLIDAYCFGLGRSWLDARKLKKSYIQSHGSIPKQDDTERNRSWTAEVSEAFSVQLANWKSHPDTADADFLQWMQTKASGLDLPSHTARRIYRNLAAYAYCISSPNPITNSESDLLRSMEPVDAIQKIADMKTESHNAQLLLFDGGTISESKCKKVSLDLLKVNLDMVQTDDDTYLLKDKDAAKRWSVVTVLPDGSLSVSGGIINSSRTRVFELLYGLAEVEKLDMLYLLWFALGSQWTEPPVDASGKMTRNTSENDILYCRIFDLKDAASIILQAAGLPDFYPPHLVESSMLLSTIYSEKTHRNPTEIYGDILDSLRKKRNRQAGSKKHTPEEKLEIVLQYQNSTLTLDECAERYKISPKSLSRWQAEFRSAGKLT